jgi:hypothetical protein
MTEDQEERLVSAWEGLVKAVGDLNETARSAISKQWPESRQPREAIISRILTAEDKIKAQTGNTDGPIDEWLGEFDPEEEIGPREREFLAAQSRQVKFTSSPKAASKAGGQSGAGTKTPRSKRARATVGS